MKNLTEISSALAKMYPELTNKKALAITRTVFDLVKQGICEIDANSRDRVSIQGFGNFAKKTTSARTVRNIKTGEPVNIDEGVRISFKVSDELRKAALAGDFKAQVPSEEAVAEDPEPEPEPAAEEKKTKKSRGKKQQEPIDPDLIPDLNGI